MKLVCRFLNLVSLLTLNRGKLSPKFGKVAIALDKNILMDFQGIILGIHNFF